MNAPRKPVLVSACLLGRACRYDGNDKRDFALERELGAAGLEPVPFCPEEAGGLPTPRAAAWIADKSAAAVVDGEDHMISAEGTDVTQAYLSGARGAVELCRERGIERAYLKERSPSCGVCRTHIAGRCVDGPGVTAEVLRRAGIAIEGVEGGRD